MAIQLHLTRVLTKGACLCPLHQHTLGRTCLQPLELLCGYSPRTRRGPQVRCWASKAYQLHHSCWDLAVQLLGGHLWAPRTTHPRVATTHLSSRTKHWPLARSHPFIAPSIHRPSNLWSLPQILVPRYSPRPRQTRPFPQDHPSPSARVGSLHHPV